MSSRMIAGLTRGCMCWATIPPAVVVVLALLLRPAARVRADDTTGPEAGVQSPGSPDSVTTTFTAPGQTGAVLPEMVVEAQNKVRQEIQKSSFTFDLDAASVDSFLSAMDEEALGISPVSGLQPHLNNLERLASDQPPHCWLPEMAAAPVATFYPADPEGHKVRTWTLTITDFRGSCFRSLTGTGTPPATVEWDGLGDRGQMLEVGYPYSYVFSITDQGTNTYNYAGVSFRIPALDHRVGPDRVLEFAGGELFPPAETELTAKGRGWLTRAADIIRRHPYSPIKVMVVAEAERLAGARADVVATFLASSMVLPREQVETEARQEPDLRAELDGSATIVVQHAK